MNEAWTRESIELLVSAWAEDGLPDGPLTAAVSFIEDTGCGTLGQFSLAPNGPYAPCVSLSPFVLYFRELTLPSERAYVIVPESWVFLRC